MTIDELKSLELPMTANGSTLLYVGAALDWLQANTTLEFDKNDTESIKALPDGAKLFICKYYDVMGANTAGVTSESIGGMSQSFSTETKNALLFQYASELIGAYLKGQVSSVPNVSNWKSGKSRSVVQKSNTPNEPQANVLIDDSTGKKYKLGVNNEKVYLTEA